MSIYLETNSDGSRSSSAIKCGKNEGIGAILQSQLFLYAICKKLKVEFYNSGFKNIGHSSYSDYSQEEWDNLFTNFFNFSTNKFISEKISFPKIDDDFFSYLSNNKEKEVLIYLEPDEVLRYGQSIISEIYEKEYLKYLKHNFILNKNYFSKKALNICFHIRSINPEDISFIECREYFDNKQDTIYLNLLNNLKKVCYNQKTHLHIYSQGSKDNFLNIINLSENKFEIILHLNENPVSDIYHMSHADLLIMSNSSYSWVSHLLNYNPTLIRDNFWHSTYPNTLKLDSDYSFNTERLRIV